MRRSARVLTLFTLTALMACGTSGSTPIRPREAYFQVVGASGTPFGVNRFDASNGPPHVFDPPREFQAPFTFVFLNAGSSVSEIAGVPPNPRVRATFLGANAVDPVTINLRLGFDANLTGTVTLPAHSTDSAQLSTPEVPEPITTPPVPPEVRVEVCQEMNPASADCADQTDQQNVPFTANIGDQDNTFLPCGDTRICTAPTIFYLENPHADAGAIISKTVADDQVLLLNLYVGGILRGTARATRSDLNAKVRFNL